MKAVGIVRNMDHLGRLVVPKELRHTYGLDEHTPVEILAQGDTIILRKYRPACSVCGEREESKLHEFSGVRLCHDCLRQFAARQ